MPSRRNGRVLPLVFRAPINLAVGSGRQRAWQFLTARLTAARFPCGAERNAGRLFLAVTSSHVARRPLSTLENARRYAAAAASVVPSSCSNHSERNAIPARTTSADIVRGSKVALESELVMHAVVRGQARSRRVHRMREMTRRRRSIGDAAMPRTRTA